MKIIVNSKIKLAPKIQDIWVFLNSLDYLIFHINFLTFFKKMEMKRDLHSKGSLDFIFWGPNSGKYPRRKTIVHFIPDKVLEEIIFKRGTFCEINRTKEYKFALCEFKKVSRAVAGEWHFNNWG